MNDIERFFPQATPDKDYIQRELSDEFVGAMLLRGGDSIETVIQRFTSHYEQLLDYIGEARQDDILKRAQTECRVDLSQWIGQEA